MKKLFYIQKSHTFYNSDFEFWGTFWENSQRETWIFLKQTITNILGKIQTANLLDKKNLIQDLGKKVLTFSKKSQFWQNVNFDDKLRRLTFKHGLKFDAAFWLFH